MIKRCTQPKCSRWKYYGGRGITVAPRWRESFVAFLQDMGECADGLTIDREDNSRGYEPGNCRWVTHLEQCRNRRSTKLSPDTVSEIRRLARTTPTKKLASHFRVSTSMIRSVVRGISWGPSRDLWGPTYQTVVIDSPWPETGGGKIKRGCDRHYNTIKTLDDLERTIRSCPYFERLADDCLGFFWVTNRFMVGGAYSDHDGPAWGPELTRRLGFRPITLVTWVKAVSLDVDEPRIDTSLGQFFRGQTEQLLFAVRGDGMRLRRAHTDRRDLGTLICAPVPRDEHGRRIHSRKPPESYDLIEAASPGPYLEIFARVRHNESWTVWGNEAPKESP